MGHEQNPRWKFSTKPTLTMNSPSWVTLIIHARAWTLYLFCVSIQIRTGWLSTEVEEWASKNPRGFRNQKRSNMNSSIYCLAKYGNNETGEFNSCFFFAERRRSELLFYELHYYSATDLNYVERGVASRIHHITARSKGADGR